MIDQLLHKIEESDKDGAAALIKNLAGKKGQAWAIHLSLFPVVQRVLNPPFINPHLPKMYRICREFLPYLEEDDIPPLVRLEINEYTRRPKLSKLKKADTASSAISFHEVEIAIRNGDQERVANLLNAFLQQKGEIELARNLLLLGSGYLNRSLGHSISCTAFILLEMMERTDQDDPWPAIAALANYFCQGGFHTTPDLRGAVGFPSAEDVNQHLLRATSGGGIVNLHHTITRYSIERVRHLLNEEEYAHMIACWVEFMGSKGITVPSFASSGKALPEYNSFQQIFSERDERAVLPSAEAMLPPEQGRHSLGRYLIKGVCHQYQGDYNPHFLTGLGSALWVVNNYWNQPLIAINALRQYLSYYFTDMNS